MNKLRQLSATIKRNQRIVLPVVVALFAVGVLSFTSAAVSTASVEPEGGSLASGASLGTGEDSSGTSLGTGEDSSGTGFIRFGSRQSPSGQAMPVGDITNWRQIFTEDFTTNVPEGGFPGTAYNTKWGVYPDNSPDTSGKPDVEGSPSRYYPSRVVSVNNGVLNKRLRTETIGGVARPLVAGLTPLLPGTPPYSSTSYTQWPNINYTPSAMQYGRYSVRFRADPIAGFKVAWLLWPETERFPQDGEVDFPEGDLNSRICAYMHRQDATVGSDQDAFCTNKGFNEWQTATIERAPGYISFILDGQEIMRSTQRLPTNKMTWRIQTETCFRNCQPSPSVTGNVQIDWVTVYAWNGGTTTPPPPSPTGNVLNEDFEGRGQNPSNGTLLNGQNSFAQINTSVPVAGFYVNDRNSYSDAPSNAVLPAFDTSRKISGTRSARFTLQSVGRNTGGGSFYHYNITSPKPKIRTAFWWQFDNAMGSAGGNPALATYRTTYSGQGLTYLRFTANRNLSWQNAGNWSNRNGTYQYQPNTWYRVDVEIDTPQSQSILTVRNASNQVVEQLTHSIPSSNQVGFFEFGALQGALQNYSTPGSFWFDDVTLSDN